MSNTNTITSSISSSSYFINGRSCSKLVYGLYNLPSIKPLKKTDQPRLLSFKINTKCQIPRIIHAPMLISGSLHTGASSSSSSSPTPPSSSSPWKKWLLGILLTVILPAAGHKGGLLVALKGKIDQAVETVEHVTEVVEEMAEKAEKIIEEVEEKLPGDSKMKKTLQSFDNLAKMAIKEAKKAEDIIHKVKHVEEEIEGVLFKVGNDQDQKK